MLRLSFMLVCLLIFAAGTSSSWKLSRDDSHLALFLAQAPQLIRWREQRVKMGGPQAFGIPLFTLEDVRLMVETGLDAYRFSISWSRLIPNGRGPVNPKGLRYYNNLINELISHDINLCRKDFTSYADVCFREFGDRVLYWSPVNEPNVYVLGGYDTGFTPPQRCSPPYGKNYCSRGNSSTEPYIAAHHILLAHASAARLYKRKYQEKKRGFVGLCIFSWWPVPVTDTKEDASAAQRTREFNIGCFC